MEPGGAFVVGDWVRVRKESEPTVESHLRRRIGRIRAAGRPVVCVDFLGLGRDATPYGFGFAERELEPATPTEEDVYAWSLMELSS